ncbi:MAG TPA: ammonium transporter [Methanomassiliicoccales archaeon]|jgi:Amt family ammonium transporter
MSISRATRIGLMVALGMILVPLISRSVSATDGLPGDVNQGDTAWLLISTALVFVMTPAVAFFYGGMLRKESFLSMLGQSVIIIGIVTLIWVLFGYSLAFGGYHRDLIGNLDFVLLDKVGGLPDLDYAPTIPSILFAMYQLMFGIITVALIIGGIAERMKLKAMIIFLAVWTCLVYLPVAHWMWGGGWLAKLGALDFAGGAVVHITAGVSVLAASIVLGKRLSVINGNGDHPHNIPMVVLGGGLLWMGWFGFNGGSALGSGSLAAQAFANTHIAGAMAAITWGLVSWLHLGRPSVLGLISGGVAGLAAVTPAAGYIDTRGAIVIGLAAGILCYCGILVRKKFKFDDALDVWGVHGIAGTMGMIAVGLLATSHVNEKTVINNGLLYGGGFTLLTAQLIAVVVIWIFAFGITFVMLKVLSRFTPIRMTKEEERVGADIIQHGETAYS